MKPKYFFITNYDDISSALVAFLLNAHPDLHCSESKGNLFFNACHAMTNSVDEWIETDIHPQKTSNGNINHYTAYELQNRILMEKSNHPLRMVNLIASPLTRIRLLMRSWLVTYKTAELAVEALEKQLQHIQNINHELIYKYKVYQIYQGILASVSQQQIDCSLAENKLFIFALTKLITEDCAGLPTSAKKIHLEKLLVNENYFMDFVQYISPSTHFTALLRVNLKQQMRQCHDYLESINHDPLQAWMHDLLANYLERRFHTIYNNHVDKPLSSLYREAGLESSNVSAQPFYSKLISIQLNSNRPAQLSLYFDNIEETADDPKQIEVLVNIDDNDSNMRDLLDREILSRSFTIKYISSPRPQSFCDLWKPINTLLTITDPHAYFLLNISDEMLFATPGWDSILKKYVGYFPDHLFRLRLSRNKFRNYFDRWECSFAQDSIPITTKKWIDIGGDWNPCFGPDSYQQLISFYLAKEGEFSGTQYLRDIPIMDIKLHGDIPSLGISREKCWKLNRDHILAMQICQSHKMQEEARRRAMLIKAHILVAKNQLSNIQIEDNKKKKQIYLINSSTNSLISKLDYHVNPLVIGLQNQLRKLRFYAYFGAGKDYPRGYPGGFAAYLKARYLFCYNSYEGLARIQRVKRWLRDIFFFYKEYFLRAKNRIIRVKNRLIRIVSQ